MGGQLARREPPGAVRVDLRRWRANYRDALRAVADLPAGTPVVLSAVAPGAIGRCRSFAADTGIEVDGEYLAFPTASAPLISSRTHRPPFVSSSRRCWSLRRAAFSHTVIEAAVVLLRALRPWRLMRVVAPGRVVVGRRL
jgi:hypothetical protein